MLGLLLLALTASPLESSAFQGFETGPECAVVSTQPPGPGGDVPHLAHAAGVLEQIVSCGTDIAVIDYFDVRRSPDQGASELEQARWGGPTPPAQLHDALLQKGPILADVSGSRATAFLLQTKLQKKGFRALGSSGVDYDTIAGAMAETLADQAPPLEGDEAAEPGPPPEGTATGDIQWMPYEDGLREAASSRKPVCLTFFTTWCPHCHDFLQLFGDPRVIEKARSFVMVRVDEDRAKELGRTYAPDGDYIPRTFFLSPDGHLDTSLTARRRGRSLYFYDERDPQPLLAGMDRALAKLAR